MTRTVTTTTDTPKVCEETDKPCRKCGGSGLFTFHDGRIGDCFPCGGTGHKLRYRPETPAETAARHARVDEYTADRDRRAAERAARRAAREATA